MALINDKLKPCPFCGKTDCLDWTDENTYYYLCGKHGSAAIQLSCKRCDVNVWNHSVRNCNYEKRLESLFQKWNRRFEERVSDDD